MAKIEDLIAQIPDERLRKGIAAEVKALKKSKKFGLVFEEHLPETVRLLRLPIKPGDLVALKRESGNQLWRVRSIKKGIATCDRAVEGYPDGKDTDREFAVSDLIVVRNFGDPIYPALVPVDRVERGGPDKPWHVLINADNFHALQLLLYCYEGTVDVIYIDPPYNTGARDWKYNNDYVDENDPWRHSKWLSFLNKRLRLAKRLLKPDGILVVTIDEHEVHHLGMLLEDLFPDAYHQMCTVVITSRGVAKQGMARVEEYAHFVFCGKASACATTDDYLTQPATSKTKSPWASLLRRGTNAAPSDRPGLVYPIIVDQNRGAIIGVGETLLEKIQRGELAKAQANAYVPKRLPNEAWPTRSDGKLGTWQVKPDTLLQLVKQGYAKLGKYDEKRHSWAINYLKRGPIKEIARGDLLIVGQKWAGGPAILEYADGVDSRKRAKTVWYRTAHDAGTYGSGIIRSILGNRAFEFPKSLYTVRDTLATLVSDRPNALMLDFFAGSGTTFHGVCLLNKADNGRRRAILITNNEISEADRNKLEAAGHSPGDDAWERLGIASAVTWPRCKNSVLGKNDDGVPLTGEYSSAQFIDREGTRTFVHLPLGDGQQLDLNTRKAIVRLIPELSIGAVKVGEDWHIEERANTTILWDSKRVGDWLEAVNEENRIDKLYIVTPRQSEFNVIKRQALEELDPVLVKSELMFPANEGFAENIEYYKLDFLDPNCVARGDAFQVILPILWMMAGCQGSRDDSKGSQPWFIPMHSPFAVLIKEKEFRAFCERLSERKDIGWVFLVTDSEENFALMRRALGRKVECVQLYKSYLENFRLNTPEALGQVGAS